MATQVKGHQRRSVNGRMHRVRRHWRNVATASRPGGIGGVGRGKGMFQGRRGVKRIKKANRSRWRKQHKIYAAILTTSGVGEIVLFVLFRSIGGLVAMVALLMSTLAAVMMAGSAQPAKRGGSRGGSVRTPPAGKPKSSKPKSSKPKSSKPKSSKPKTSKPKTNSETKPSEREPATADAD